MVDGAPESVWNFLGQFGFIVVGAGMVLLAVFAWTGWWRAWAAALPLGLGAGSLNFFPFSAGLLGAGIACFGLSVNAEFGYIPGSAGFYDALGIAFAAVSLISMLWWPQRLAPGWHRDWLAWGGPEVTDPWPTDEEREEGRR